MTNKFEQLLQEVTQSPYFNAIESSAGVTVFDIEISYITNQTISDGESIEYLKARVYEVFLGTNLTSEIVYYPELDELCYRKNNVTVEYLSKLIKRKMRKFAGNPVNGVYEFATE